MISGFTDFNDRDQQFMDSIEDEVQQMKVNLMPQNHNNRNVSFERNDAHMYTLDPPAKTSRKNVASITPIHNKSIIKNQSLDNLHNNNNANNNNNYGGVTPEMKQRLNNQIKSRQLLERIKPRDSRERQSIEAFNQLNEKKVVAKFEVKYDKDLNDY